MFSFIPPNPRSGMSCEVGGYPDDQETGRVN